MIEDDIKLVIEKNYSIPVKSIEKVKSIYKVKSTNEDYCLKVINYQYPHFYFILSAIEHLQNRGFRYIPYIMKTVRYKNYIEFNSKFAYLTPWLKCRESNYDNLNDLKSATIKLAELHNCSEGFTLNKDMRPRVGWFTWIKMFETKAKEIISFKNIINKKVSKSEFDILYLNLMSGELKKIEDCIEMLKDSNYYEVMKKQVFKRGFCHHDYAHHNVLIDERNNINLIDFDYCILDTNLHDLSSLCIRTMKEGKWNIKTFRNIVENYTMIKSVSYEEENIMSILIKFPQAYWQLGIQYYWEQQPWDEEVFIKKLTKYNNDKNMRENFVKEIYRG